MTFEYGSGGEGGIRTNDRVAPITVFELAGTVRQRPSGATSYCGNGSEVLARAGWCCVISGRSARAVHTSDAVRHHLRGTRGRPVRHAR